MSRFKPNIFITIAAFLLILSGLLLNVWFLDSLVFLKDGQRSLLRVIIIWLYDVFAVSYGVILIGKKNKLSINLKAVFFSGMSVFLVLLFSELTLQVLARLVPSFDRFLSGKTVAQATPDEKFGNLPNPLFPGHDSNGFRNRKALTRAEIVAIGDSFTYGIRVELDQTWPYQLERLCGRPVYNMSYGGYGCVEGLMLLHKAFELKPSLVIFAMYNGNDLFDAYRAVYYRNQFPEFKTKDSSWQQSISTLDHQDPLEKKVIKAMGLQPAGQEQTASSVSSRPKAVWSSIKHLKLLRMFFALEVTLQNTIVNTPYRAFRKVCNDKNRDPQSLEIFNTRDFKTVFTPAYRLLAENLEDPRIEEGLRISYYALLEMKLAAQSHSVKLLVLLIPTKERVFYEIYPAYDLKVSETMHLLIKQEDEIRRRTMEFLHVQEIPYIDLLPVLRDCFETGRQPYSVDSDGHLSPAGQTAVAGAVYQYMKNVSFEDEKKPQIP